MKYCGISDIGLKRSENQDSFIVNRIFDGAVLAVVCDGMGGAAGGRVAAELASKCFFESIKQDITQYINSELDISFESTRIINSILISAVEKANLCVYNKAENDQSLSGMGTTLTAALFIGKHVYAVNVGDSRIYRFSEKLIQMTRDHSYVQSLVDMGKITHEEAEKHPQRNVITRAVGIESDVLPDTYNLTAANGDVFMLCSDGLCGYVNHVNITSVLASDITLEEKNKRLVELANSAGGADNITAVLITY